MTVPVIEIRHTLDRLSANLGLLAGERLQAAVRALNRTMTTVRAEAAREVQREYTGLRIAAIKKRLRFTRATRTNPSATITFSGKRIPLYGNFNMRGVGRWGVRFRGLPWRLETVTGESVTGEMLERAFRQRSRRTSRADVFARHTAQRASFELVLAPGIARAFAERGIGVALERVARSRFEVVFQQEAKFRLSKRAAGSGPIVNITNSGATIT